MKRWRVNKFVSSYISVGVKDKETQAKIYSQVYIRIRTNIWASLWKLNTQPLVYDSVVVLERDDNVHVINSCRVVTYNVPYIGNVIKNPVVWCVAEVYEKDCETSKWHTVSHGQDSNFFVIFFFSFKPIQLLLSLIVNFF